MSGETTAKAKIFASWSGDSSKEIARHLAWFVEKLLQATEVWFSPESIELGEPWALRIAEALEDTKYGFAVVTPENKDSVWVHYEAGAIAGKLKSARFAPLLFGMEVSDIGSSPLRYLQSAEWSQDACWRLVVAINDLLGALRRGETALKEDFEETWPRLAEKIATVSTKKGKSPKAAVESLEAKVQRIENLVRDIHSRLPGADSNVLRSDWVSLQPAGLLGSNRRAWSDGEKNRFLITVLKSMTDNARDAPASDETEPVKS